VSDDFRCAAASAGDREPLAGTAPPEASWLFVEYAGAWGRQAVAESRLPAAVRDYLTGPIGHRVQLIRRYGGTGGSGVRLFRADLARPLPQVQSALLDDLNDLTGIDELPWADHSDPLWLVCTNGSRDRCCTEFGRPIAARLSERWPTQTWETTHLGGHRFSGTMLALPSGLVLGRLDPSLAVEAAEEILAAQFPTGPSRGRAGRSPRAQVAELRLREDHPGLDLDGVRLVGEHGDRVRLETPQGAWTVEVATEPGPERRQSCAETTAKPTTRYRVIAVRPA
jgi:hypothetical protein